MNFNNFSSTNIFDNAYLIGGITYLSFGLIGATFVSYVLCSMQLIQGARECSSFYFLSTFCLVCDLICILISGIYYGTLLILEELAKLKLPSHDFFSSLFYFVWSSKGVFLILVAWTRLASVRSITIQTMKTSKLQKRVCFSLLFIALLGATVMSNTPCVILYFSFQQLTLSMNLDSSVCIIGLQIFSIAGDFVKCATLLSLNITIIILYLKKRINLSTDTQFAATFIRERKLFIQCGVSTLFFLFGNGQFFLTGQLVDKTPVFHHIFLFLANMTVFFDTSIVYVALNGELREQMRHFSIKKLFSAGAQQPSTTFGWLSGLWYRQI